LPVLGQPLLICGTHSFAAEVADLVSEIPELELAGFVENSDRSRCEEPLQGLPVHWVEDIGPLAATHRAVCAIGSTERSGFTRQVEELGVEPATVVHPTARIAPSATIAPGAIVSAGVIVAAHTTVGRHAILNRGVLVGHHTQVGDHASLMPGANIAGMCHIGEAAYIGLGAIVLDNLTVGASALVGAGALVTRDIPEHTQAMGLPARIVREGVNGR
jgi:acetyltransferase EpsM